MVDGSKFGALFGDRQTRSCPAVDVSRATLSRCLPLAICVIGLALYPTSAHAWDRGVELIIGVYFAFVAVVLLLVLGLAFVVYRDMANRGCPYSFWIGLATLTLIAVVLLVVSPTEGEEFRTRHNAPAWEIVLTALFKLWHALKPFFLPALGVSMLVALISSLIELKTAVYIRWKRAADGSELGVWFLKQGAWLMYRPHPDHIGWRAGSKILRGENLRLPGVDETIPAAWLVPRAVADRALQEFPQRQQLLANQSWWSQIPPRWAGCGSMGWQRWATHGPEVWRRWAVNHNRGATELPADTAALAAAFGVPEVHVAEAAPVAQLAPVVPVRPNALETISSGPSFNWFSAAATLAARQWMPLLIAASLMALVPIFVYISTDGLTSTIGSGRRQTDAAPVLLAVLLALGWPFLYRRLASKEGPPQVARIGVAALHSLYWYGAFTVAMFAISTLFGILGGMIAPILATPLLVEVKLAIVLVATSPTIVMPLAALGLLMAHGVRAPAPMAMKAHYGHLMVTCTVQISRDWPQWFVASVLIMLLALVPVAAARLLPLPPGGPIALCFAWWTVMTLILTYLIERSYAPELGQADSD